MQVNVAQLSEWFAEYNAKYFADKLPLPTIAIGRSRTRLGSMEWKSQRKWLLKTSESYTIRISNYYDMEEKEFKNVLLHEMIHLQIVSQHMKDTSPHGKIFRQRMKEINADGWNITVSTKMSEAQKASTTRKRKRQRLILAITTHSQKYLLSVVSPKYAREINRILRLAPDVKSHSWFVSSDDYFSSFPTVRTPKGRCVTKEIYEEKTASMTPFEL
ncbi:MAG: SprT-like domain-containing protein [Prevotellaceae bacterium]|nr:SprT-like domain-containing protein [Prevotellaceae bacterium]